MERRKPKETDQKNIEKAFNLLKYCIAQYPEIESILWCSACWSILASGYNSSGISHEEFCRECDKIKHHYKSWFDE